MIRKPVCHPGLTCICTAAQDHTGMNISIWQAEPFSELKIWEPDQETAVLLIEGEVEVCAASDCRRWSRTSVFEQKAKALHICRGTSVILRCLKACEVLIQQAVNEKEFPAVFYDETNITQEVFGAPPIQETTRRIVTTIFDADSAPESRMVLGEIINQPGIWSSYPPHYHPQPEVYYYRFSQPQGFGTCYIGNECFKVTDRCAALIEGGKTHPQNAAPGYAMYYVWMIPHQPEPWLKTRIMDPDHVWLCDPQAEINNSKEE